jgi:pilus assembly protein Flp/PilA
VPVTVPIFAAGAKRSPPRGNAVARALQKPPGAAASSGASTKERRPMLLQKINRSIARARLLRDTRGANMVEYIAIILLVAVVGITAFRTFGTTVSTKIGEGNTEVGGL